MPKVIALIVSKGKVLLDKLDDDYIFPAYESDKSSLMVAHEIVEDYLGISPNWGFFHYLGELDQTVVYLALVQESVSPRTNLSEWVDISTLPNLAGDIHTVVNFLSKVVGHAGR